jgi:outer membrane lipoprotein-sorting protein
MNILRRLPLSRLLLVCAVMVAVGVSATALAFGLDSGPTPPSKPLAEAVHDALAAPPVEGVSASVHLTNHLLEGAGLASAGGQAGQLASSPLFSGASGRLWIAKDGRVRLELQSEKGDTQVLYDGHTVSLYDASSNTLYRYAIPAGKSPSTDPSTPDQSGSGTAEHREVPTIAKIEEAITHLKPHATLSGATPTSIAGQPAYTTNISPSEGGSLIGGAEVSWDAVHGVPLRAAVYSSGSSSPVIELTTTEVSYGPVDDSVFSFTPPSGTKINEVSSPTKDAATHTGASPSDASAPKGSSPKVTTRGHGIAQIAILESKAAQGSSKPSSNLPEGLPKVKVNGASASELPTALGTLLSFERSGVRYLLLGAVTPAAIEAVAKGL